MIKVLIVMKRDKHLQNLKHMKNLFDSSNGLLNMRKYQSILLFLFYFHHLFGLYVKILSLHSFGKK